MKKAKSVLMGTMLALALCTFAGCGTADKDKASDESNKTAEDKMEETTKTEIIEATTLDDNAGLSTTDEPVVTGAADGTADGTADGAANDTADNAADNTADGDTGDGTDTGSGTAAGDLGDGVKAIGDGVGDAVEDVGDAIGNAAEGK